VAVFRLRHSFAHHKRSSAHIGYTHTHTHTHIIIRILRIRYINLIDIPVTDRCNWHSFLEKSERRAVNLARRLSAWPARKKQVWSCSGLAVSASWREHSLPRASATTSYTMPSVRSSSVDRPSRPGQRSWMTRTWRPGSTLQRTNVSCGSRNLL